MAIAKLTAAQRKVSVTNEEIRKRVISDDKLYLLWRRSKQPRQSIAKFVEENRETLLAIIQAKRAE